MTDRERDSVDPKAEPDAGPAEGGDALAATAKADNAEAVLDRDAEGDEPGATAGAHADRLEGHVRERGTGAGSDVDDGHRANG